MTKLLRSYPRGLLMDVYLLDCSTRRSRVMYRHTDRNCFLPAEQSKNIHIRVLGSETRTMFRTASCVNCSGATLHVLEASRRVPTYLRLVAGIKLFVRLSRGQGIRSIFHRGTGHQIRVCCNWALEYHTLILFFCKEPL